MIILNVTPKQFGKNFIDYKVTNKETNQLINIGTCRKFSFINELFYTMRAEYGDDKVRMLK